VNILVTGATGFVGSVLMPRLVAAYGTSQVTAFVLPGVPIPSAWAGKAVRIIRGDILDGAAVSDAVAGHTHVVHLAGYISYAQRDAEHLMRVNRDGVRNVVDACLGGRVQRLVHISSVGAVGFHRSGAPADEETPFNWPASLGYMVSKHEGQNVVEDAARRRGLPAVVLNPASVMGPGDWNPATPHNQLYRMLCGKRLTGTFTGGLAVVDVRDLAAAILAALAAGRVGERYLIVGANLSYRDVIRLVTRACGRESRVVPVPALAVTMAGSVVELASRLTGRPPLLTYAYGRLSGWRAYYANEKSRRELGATYRAIGETILDGWEFFRATFGERRP
jgi:dihydroflavonol-4-reductase